MRQLQPVLWTKGVLLTPQHLQTQDRFLEDLLELQLSALTFCPWGFQRLNIDREALAGGVLGISQAAGILPDGLLFEIPDADPAPPPRPLETCWQPDQQTLDIYLAIPEQRDNGLNVSSGQRDRNTRYLAEVLLRRDENTGLAEKPLVVARKNFRILVEGEAIEGHTTLPLARVVRSSAGTYQLDPQFVPPLVDISASEYLMAVARRLVELLSAKSSALADRRRQKNQSLAEFGIADVGNFWLLYTVNTHLPDVRHIFEVRHGHPADLYAVMLALGGALTTFSTTVHPRDLPAYDHANLSRCFGELDEKLRLLLETVVPANYVSLPMRTVRPAVYASALERDEYLAADGWYLAVNAELEQAKLMRAVPELVKVSSADHIEHLIKQALPGLQLTHIASPPGAIPVKTGFQYFRVGKTGPEWQAITRARNVAAYVPAELPGAQLELLVVLPTK
ncbi:MAG TPA: type VI secretion system baseplate subunit TssK [Gemmatimonadales bacterium]|jgi:type VI secretion system protein ImpJ|nr:type VI secretion system baseplate subunit TssK [Gemmatimonadales bacterium]